MREDQAKSQAGLLLVLAHSLPQVEDGLGEVGGAAEVAPVVFISAKGEDFLALGGEAKVRVHDGEDALFGQQGEEARGDDVDVGEGEGVKKWRVRRRSRLLDSL